MPKASGISGFGPPVPVALHPVAVVRPPTPPESAKARAAYADYEAMGSDRSLAKLAAKYGKSPAYVRQLERWSQRYQWQARLKDYERGLLDARRAKREIELEEMDERHALYARAALYKAAQFVEAHFEKEATVAHAISLFRVAAELERLARGAATTRIEGEVGVTVLPKEYINLSDDEEGSEP